MPKTDELRPELAAIDWTGRRVYICFDSDLIENGNVQLAEWRLLCALRSKGASVKCVRLPHGASKKCGLDDYLVQYGADELRVLMASAIVPCKPEYAEKDDAKNLDYFVQATQFVKSADPLRFWRGDFYSWTGSSYRVVVDDEVRASVHRFLNPRFRKVSAAAVSNCLDHLKALTILDYTEDAPHWIGAPMAPWNLTDCLFTKNSIIHLPSLTKDKAPDDLVNVELEAQKKIVAVKASDAPAITRILKGKVMNDYMMPVTPELFSLNALAFDFDANAPRPDKWLRFLSELWEDDAASIELLQEWFGYLLTADTRQQKIMLLIGPPRSGKGTIGRILGELLGKTNVCAPTLASLASNFGLSPLVGKLAAVISDARLSGRTDSAIVVERLLSISGEDYLTIDRKFAQPLPAVRLPCRVMILSNELPQLADASSAIARRMLILQLRKSFLGIENPGLTDELREELPGILNWAIAGWKRLKARGYFCQSMADTPLHHEMEALASPVAAFVEEICEVSPDATIPCNELHVAFSHWCARAGRRAEDEARFGKLLRAALPSLEKVRPRVEGGRQQHWQGITVSHHSKYL